MATPCMKYMVDIQSPTTEIRQGKKKEEEDRNHRAKI